MAICIRVYSCLFVVTNCKRNHEWTRMDTNYYSFVIAKKMSTQSRSLVI